MTTDDRTQPGTAAPTSHRAARATVPPARRTAAARTGAAAALAGTLVLVPALAASAHVRVTADDPTGGAYSILTFRVPNESDTAGTTGLAVEMPTDTPLTFVSVEPVPGWTAEVERGDLPEPVQMEEGEVTQAVLSVTWTADDGVQVAPGEFQRFVVLAGPLPEEGTDVVLPATQTYSDGEVVAWDETVAEGEEEPESPAPAFTTVAAAEDHGAAAEVTTASSSTTAAGSSSSAPTDPTARWLGAGGLALGAVAVLVALVGTGRRRAGR